MEVIRFISPEEIQAVNCVPSREMGKIESSTRVTGFWWSRRKVRTFWYSGWGPRSGSRSHSIEELTRRLENTGHIVHEDLSVWSPWSIQVELKSGQAENFRFWSEADWFDAIKEIEKKCVFIKIREEDDWD